MVARSRWASLARLLVCRRTGLVVRMIPRGPAAYGRSARDGPSAPGERKTKERGSPVCSTRTSSICPTSEAAEPRGAREARCRGRLPRGSGRQNSFCCDYRKENDAGKAGIALNACADSEVALGESRLQGSQASLNSNCQKTGESNFFHLRQRNTLHATSSSTLSNSTNGWSGWQRRS